MAKSKKVKKLANRKKLLPQRVFKTPMADFALGFFGLCLAAASGYLPVYIYSNGSEFSPPQMALSRQGLYVDSPELEREVDRRRALFRDIVDIDPTITGSIEPAELKAETPKTPPKKAIAEVIPDDQERTNSRAHKTSGDLSGWTIVFATGRRALVQFGDDIVPISVGSKLPDGKIVKRWAQVEGTWKLYTRSQLIDQSNLIGTP